MAQAPSTKDAVERAITPALVAVAALLSRCLTGLIGRKSLLPVVGVAGPTGQQGSPTFPLFVLRIVAVGTQVVLRAIQVQGEGEGLVEGAQAMPAAAAAMGPVAVGLPLSTRPLCYVAHRSAA